MPQTFRVKWLLLALTAGLLQLTGCDDTGGTTPNTPPVDAASVTEDGSTSDRELLDRVELDAESPDPDMGEVDGGTPDISVDPEVSVDSEVGVEPDLGPDLGSDFGVEPSTPGLRGRLTWTGGQAGIGAFIGGGASRSQQMNLQGRLRWLQGEAR